MGGGIAGGDLILRWLPGGVSVERCIGVVAVEAGGRLVGVAYQAQPAAEADGIRGVPGGSVLLQLIVILSFAYRALVVAAAGKGAFHGDGGRIEERKLIVAIANVLEAGIVH